MCLFLQKSELKAVTRNLHKLFKQNNTYFQHRLSKSLNRLLMIRQFYAKETQIKNLANRASASRSTHKVSKSQSQKHKGRIVNSRLQRGFVERGVKTR